MNNIRADTDNGSRLFIDAFQAALHAPYIPQGKYSVRERLSGFTQLQKCYGKHYDFFDEMMNNKYIKVLEYT